MNAAGARRVVADLGLSEYVRSTVADWPEPDEETVDFLRRVLRPLWGCDANPVRDETPAPTGPALVNTDHEEQSRDLGSV